MLILCRVESNAKTVTKIVSFEFAIFNMLNVLNVILVLDIIGIV